MNVSVSDKSHVQARMSKKKEKASIKACILAEFIFYLLVQS